MRHRGGGAKRRLRIIDFKRDKIGVPGTVASIEYDPNRTARIALIHYADGDKRYILAPWNLPVGQTIVSGPEAPIKVGNTLPLRVIPTGTTIHNIEMKPGKGGQLVRGSGTAAQLLAKDGIYSLLRLPSGELRRVESEWQGYHRAGGQPGPEEHKARQGGPEPVEGQETFGQRLGHESSGPSARGRRGSVSRGHARTKDPVGQACTGIPYQKEKEVQQHDREEAEVECRDRSKRARSLTPS